MIGSRVVAASSWHRSAKGHIISFKPLSWNSYWAWGVKPPLPACARKLEGINISTLFWFKGMMHDFLETFSGIGSAMIRFRGATQMTAAVRMGDDACHRAPVAGRMMRRSDFVSLRFHQRESQQ
ncbi:hypothetical protein ACFFXZ_03915 [Massilia antarctica]